MHKQDNNILLVTERRLITMMKDMHYYMMDKGFINTGYGLLISVLGRK